MTACQRCGTERTVNGYCGAQGQHAVCRLRAELRDLRAERDALVDIVGVLREKVALHEARQVIFEESDRDLRAAVLKVAKPMRNHSATGAKWAAELRDAVEK